VAKEVYSEFNKSKLSNIYNSEMLKTDNESYNTQIVELNDQIGVLKTEIDDVDEKILKGKEYRDDMLKKKHGDIDHEISLMNPAKTQEEIDSLEQEKTGFQKKAEELKVIEPKEFYHEDQHDKIKEEYNDTFKLKIELDMQINEIEKLKSSVSDGIKCEHCGIELMNASITQAKIAELDGYIMHKGQKEELMQVLTGKEQSFVQLKKDFDEYEKNKLIKEKYELSIESCDLKIGTLKGKLDSWGKVQDKIKENTKIDEMLIKADLRLDELDNIKKTKNSQISNNEYQIKSLNEKIENNKGLIDKIKLEEGREKIYKIYLEAYGKNGLSKIIMKTMMPLINSELQRLMEDSCYFKLEIRINDKNEVEFLMVDNSTGIEKLMVSGSGYERTIASLALRSVLSKICTLPKPNIVVFDEVFGKISNDNLEMVSEFFQKIKEYFGKVFLISHNPMISQWGDTIVKIEKENNVSRVIG
jgi:DNA repair exonuclease SbcCD ATPase subunit